MFDLAMFTLIHVVISVLGIITGLVVVGGLLAGARLDDWTALFLATTILTSVTGFGFPFTKVLPSHIVGGVSIVVLGVCLAAQLFAKTPPLAQLAPTQQGAPFAVTQALVLALFVWLGWAALRSFWMEKVTG